MTSVINELYFVPHPDDELVIFGASLQSGDRSRKKIIICFSDSGEQKQKRQKESKRFFNLIGISNYMFLDFPESFHLASEKWGEFGKNINRILEIFSPERIFIPAFEGAHADHDFLHATVVSALSTKNTNIKVCEMSAYNLYDWTPSFGRLIPDQKKVEGIIELTSKYSFSELTKCYPSQRHVLKKFRDFSKTFRRIEYPGNFTQRPGNRLTYAEVVLKQNYDEFLIKLKEFLKKIYGLNIKNAGVNKKYICFPAESEMHLKPEAVIELPGRTFEIDQIIVRRTTCLYKFANRDKPFFIKRSFFHQSLEREIRNLITAKELGIPTPSLYGYDADHTMYIGEWLEKQPGGMLDRELPEHIGKAIADMHNNHSEIFHKTFYCPGDHHIVEKWDTFKETFISTLKDTLRLWFEIRKNDITPEVKKRLLVIAKELIEQLNLAELEPKKYSWVHGDLTFWNIIYTLDRHICFIDFNHGMYYDPAYEMAYFSFSPPFFPHDTSIFDEIMKHYQKHATYIDSGFGQRFKLYRLIASFINILVYIKPDPPYHTIFNFKLFFRGNVEFIERRFGKINIDLGPLTCGS